MSMPRLRNLLIPSNSAIPLKSMAAQFASFHSSPISRHNHKNKPHFDAKGAPSKQQSKNHIRIAIRQRRTDMKKALEDFLYKSGSSKFPFQEEEPLCKPGWHKDEIDHSHKKNRSKSSARNDSKSRQKKNKRKSRRESFYEIFTDPETTCNSQFGSFYKNSEPDWRDHLNWKSRSKSWESISDFESDDESNVPDSSSDRVLLDLPPHGPLKIEDVKKAFHLSALKWHPDMHPAPSQEMAEEKFKLCVDAYKSLCKSCGA